MRKQKLKVQGREIPGRHRSLCRERHLRRVKPSSSRTNPRNPWSLLSFLSIDLPVSQGPGSPVSPALPPARQHTGQMLCLPGFHFSISVTHRTYLSVQKGGVRKRPGNCPRGFRAREQWPRSLTRAGGISDRSLPVNMSLQWHRLEGRRVSRDRQRWPAVAPHLMNLDRRALQDFLIWALSVKLEQLWPKLVGPEDPQGPWGFS